MFNYLTLRVALQAIIQQGCRGKEQILPEKPLTGPVLWQKDVPSHSVTPAGRTCNIRYCELSIANLQGRSGQMATRVFLDRGYDVTYLHSFRKFK